MICRFIKFDDDVLPPRLDIATTGNLGNAIAYSDASKKKGKKRKPLEIENNDNFKIIVLQDGSHVSAIPLTPEQAEELGISTAGGGTVWATTEKLAHQPVTSADVEVK